MRSRTGLRLAGVAALAVAAPASAQTPPPWPKVQDGTLRPRPGTRLTLDPGHSRIRLPIVGGAAAFGL